MNLKQVDKRPTSSPGISMKKMNRTVPTPDGPFRSPRELEMEEWTVLDKMLPIILYHRKGCLVEVGIGRSTFYMCKHGSDFNRIVYSVDMNSEKSADYSYDRFYNGHKSIWGSSEEFIKVFNEPCAVVLIDGAHDYDTAKMEFDFFFGKLVEGGVIFIHDTYPPVADEADYAAFLQEYACGNVYRLRQDLEKRRDEMEIFTWPYTAKWAGLTMVLKKEKELPYWGK